MTTFQSTGTRSLEPIALGHLPTRPLVSILVANFNYEKYLSETIESALNQTYADFELLICDDGSSDGSVALIEQYTKKDSRVRLIQKENGGHGSALNAAYRVSRGQIICLLDSDDLFLSTKVAEVVACCQANPESGFIIHRVIRIDHERHRQGVWPMSDAMPEGWHGETLLAEGGVLAFLPPTSGISLRREVADAVFPMPTERPLGICPDQVIMRLAPLTTKVAKIDQALAEYRLHQSNTYGTSSITTAFLAREMSICEGLWEAQKRYLSVRSSTLAERLAPVDTNSYLLYLRYLHSRLSGDPSQRQRHSEYMADLRKHPEARWVRFWAISIYLPRFVFDFAINLMSRQSAIKQLLARLKGFA